MVNVGIFGLGAHWETFYLPALQSLGKRMAVRAVYDPVSTRAELAARELGGAAVHGLTALAERSDVQAILLLDAAWHGDASLSIVRRQRKPVYIADRLPHNLVTLDQFHSDAIAEGLTFMPEFGRRYTPATCRLRELIATQLGRPQRILIETAFPRIDAAISPTDRVLLADLLIGWTDWCRYVVRTKPMVIEAKQH